MGHEPRTLTSFETTRVVAGCVYTQRGGAQIPTRPWLILEAQLCHLMLWKPSSVRTRSFPPEKWEPGYRQRHPSASYVLVKVPRVLAGEVGMTSHLELFLFPALCHLTAIYFYSAHCPPAFPPRLSLRPPTTRVLFTVV